MYCEAKWIALVRTFWVFNYWEMEGTRTFALLVVWETILFFSPSHGCLNSVEINSFYAAKLPIETQFVFNKSFSPEQFPEGAKHTHNVYT